MRLTRRGEERGELQVRRTRGLVIVPDEAHGEMRAPTLVEAMIRHARIHRGRGVQLVQTEFNGTTIIVARDSDAELIIRDYYRAFCGHRKIKIVGPYPETDLPGLETYTKTQLADPAIWNILRPPIA